VIGETISHYRVWSRLGRKVAITFLPA